MVDVRGRGIKLGSINQGQSTIDRMSPLLSPSTILLLSLVGCTLLAPGTFSEEKCSGMIDRPSTPCRAILLNAMEHTLNFIRDFPKLCWGKDSCEAPPPEGVEGESPPESPPAEPESPPAEPEAPPAEPEAPSPDSREIEVSPDSSPETKIKFELEKGVKQNFTITYKIEPYPLDLYLLFDISGSMGDDKENIVKLSASLIETLKTITNDFTLGYGAYSDKDDPYTFKSHLPLSADTSNFQAAVIATAIAGGGDLPEDAGTGLAQVAICDTQIGWRKSARKMIMLLTDASFHVAGDFPAGVPFDDACHLDAEGVFTAKSTMDYPSLAQITKALNDKSISVIFGITSGWWDTTTTAFYNTLAASVPPSSVGALDSDSANMLEILKEKYNATASKLELATVGAVSPDLSIKFLSDCGTGGAVTETKVCSGLMSGSSVTFTVELTLDTCPADSALWEQIVGIEALGLSRPITADLKLLCSDAGSSA